MTTIQKDNAQKRLGFFDPWSYEIIKRLVLDDCHQAIELLDIMRDAKSDRSAAAVVGLTELFMLNLELPPVELAQRIAE